MHFGIDIAAVPFLQLRDVRIALEQRIALLVNLKLFEAQVGDAVRHIAQLLRRGQRLLLLIKDTRQQQAAFQHGNLLFYVTLGLQSAIEPGLHFDVALNQLITIFRRRNQSFAKLVVNLQLLLHQRVCLNTRRFVRGNRFLSRLFRQRQALAIHRFLQ